MRENMSPEVRDAALIAAQRAMEHYEMAGSGTARTSAQLLGEDHAQMLEQTLEEEKMADEQLVRQINVQAMDR